MINTIKGNDKEKRKKERINEVKGGKKPEVKEKMKEENEKMN
jgi:hypothetical protein